MAKNNNKKNDKAEIVGIEQNTMITVIEKIVRKIKKFVKDNGDIDKGAVRNAVSNLDEELIKELLKNKIAKKEYFNKIENVWVFNQNKFIDLFDSVKFLGDSYTKFKADIGLIDANEKFIVDNDDVVLSFPFKDCMLEFDSTDVDDKREEYFINERIAKDKIDVMLEPKVFVNCKKIDKNGESKKSNCEKFDIEKDNLIIKGNNLLAMHSLLPRYEGKIKLMYWDILYNTNDDIVPYADSFKHSSWLVMMKNRLDAARKLLNEDGIIMIHCDFNEMHYLKVILDEVFERQNYISTITCKVKSSGGLTAGTEMVFDCSEYILIYAKTKNYSFNNIKVDVELINKNAKTVSNYNQIIYNVDFKKKELIKKQDGFSWYRLPKNSYKIENIDIKNLNESDFYNLRDKIFRLTALSGGIGKKIKNHIENISRNDDMLVYEYVPSKGRDRGKLSQYLLFKKQKVSMLNNYIRIDEVKKEIYKTEDISNIFANDWWQGISSEGGVTLNNGKKPEILLKTLLEMATEKNDIVLDAYFGTGTTGAVAMKMGRRFIGIEQLDEHFENKAKVRLKNVINGDETGISKLPDVNWKGGGAFVSVELAKLNANFIEEINEIDKKNEKKLLDVYKRIIKNPYLNCYVDVNKLIDQTNKFNKLNFTEKKKILIQLLDKNQLYVNYMDMNDKEFKISDIDKKFTNNFYKKED